MCVMTPINPAVVAMLSVSSRPARELEADSGVMQSWFVE